MPNDQMPRQIKNLGNGATSTDGKTVRFEVRDDTGGTHPFSCSTNDVERIVSWLIGLAQLGHKQAPRDEEPSSDTTKTLMLAPIEARRLEISKGRTPEETMIAIDLGPFHLAFAILTNEIYKLKDVIEKMTPT